MSKSSTPSRPSRLPKRLTLSGGALTISDVIAVARYGAKVVIGPDAVQLMLPSRRVVERALGDGLPHYGINTGFGSLAQKRISDSDLSTLQRNLVRSHSAGVGEPLPADVVRGMMLLLCASLCRGFSGVRPLLAGTLAEMLNKGVVPYVPSVGSVGASGDLAPLAAVANVVIGEGRAMHAGRVMGGAQAMKRAGIKPVVLAAKEGLALINGTHLMAAQGALLCHDATRLHHAANVALAMSIDAMRATDAFLDARLYAARNHAGSNLVAERVRGYLRGSQIIRSHVKNDPRVQDPYSLRAAPTVLGAAWHAMTGVTCEIEEELQAVTDNPLVFVKGPIATALASAREITSDGEAIVSGANFHGMPLAIPLDYLAIALCHVAGIAERRIYLMTGAFDPESHLKPFLARNPGLQSGMMIAQYTAAACVNEMITLAPPASVSNIPTSAGQEDYNSFGPRAAAKARRAMDLAEHVVAIELMCAAQGVEMHRPLRSGKGVEAVIKTIRNDVAPLTDDRPLTGDIEAIVAQIRDGMIS
ncbi:MAG: histidine ammonia-lyase [Phycisphaerales bacterium]